MERKVAQNIYDQPELFAAYCQLPRSVHGLDGAPEWAAVHALLPNLDGKRVLDLGCGFGGLPVGPESMEPGMSSDLIFRRT
jgi:hypothetical protein